MDLDLGLTITLCPRVIKTSVFNHSVVISTSQLSEAVHILNYKYALKSTVNREKDIEIIIDNNEVDLCVEQEPGTTDL